MSVDVRQIGDRAIRNRVLPGQNYSEAVLISAAISGRIIRVLAMSVDAVGGVSGSIQVAVLNSGGSGSETVVYEHNLGWEGIKTATNGFGLAISPTRTLAPLQVPISKIPDLQNGQSLVCRTNNTANSGLYSASALFWSDED